ncbi:PREDICTED: transmembrane protein 70, mitochondrial [Thamnophis sirtalis]|uniref:Transmembrane protein 70, mitochondrial n=1 Tax=Thamnophis sirtalis TaxID=35019 RepID=A0A6I9XBN6_9SAUR|nr:PREDICTED: transmembrane protein 70, mitochondrial [Thamnophis sirtalis]
MLLVAGLRFHAPGLKLWQQSAGRCRELQQAKRLAGMPEKRQPFTVSHCKLLTPLGSPRAFASRFWLGGKKQVPFFHAESLCRFGTLSLEEHSEYGRLIYSGTLSKMILGVKTFCFTTSIITASMLFAIIHKYGLNFDKIYSEIAFYSITLFFIFLTPLILHLFTRRYIIRLYYKDKTDTYTAITYSGILREKKTLFHQKDVTVPDMSKMFTTFYVKRRAMFVNPFLFNYAQDYSHLMGYDKPFQFDLKDSKK